LVGIDSTAPLTEQPVALPFVAMYVTVPPLPPVVANVREVFIGDIVAVTIRGDEGAVSVELDIE
jgi:hypothetical protein